MFRKLQTHTQTATYPTTHAWPKQEEEDNSLTAGRPSHAFLLVQPFCLMLLTSGRNTCMDLILQELSSVVLSSKCMHLLLPELRSVVLSSKRGLPCERW